MHIALKLRLALCNGPGKYYAEPLHPETAAQTHVAGWVQVSLEEGFLICPFADPSKPNEKRKFAVTKGVPNLLLDEHEC